LLKLETIPCPYCGSGQSKAWAEENGFTAVQCSACGLVFVNPRPAPDAIDEAIHLGMHATESGTLVVSNFSAKTSQQKIVKMQKRLAQLYPSGELQAGPVSWLDIGAGYGELLLALAGYAHPQSTLQGVEPCQPKLEKAHELGVQMRASLDEIAPTFGYVSLINVLSHLPDPAGFLSTLKARLVPGGELLLVTGNGGDLRRADYPDLLLVPDHLIFAGEEHVIGLLEQAGFDVVKISRYRDFLPRTRRPLKSILINTARHTLKRLRGRPSSYRLFPARGPFRSLWVRARLRS
jgi:SAM-dependent methyltransferase